MLVETLIGLSLLALTNASAVYLAPAEEPRYRGHVQRIDVFVATRKAGVPQVAVRFHHPEGSFAFVAEGPSALRLLSANQGRDLTRYVLLSSHGQTLEFRDRQRNGSVLPFSFTTQSGAVLPVCLDDRGRFLPETNFLGDVFTRDEIAMVGNLPVPQDVKVIILDDDLLIGTSRNSRDIDGRRITREEFLRDASLDYTYRPHDEKDLARMISAGFNYFDRVLPEQLDYLFDKPVFFDLRGFEGDGRPVFPEILFHPGFQGVEDFLDEPAYIFSEDFEPGDEVSLEEMARLQEKRTQAEFDRVARGRQPGLMQRLDEAGIHMEGELIEPAFPIWEEFYSTGCYQLHVPVSGFIHEGRYQHPEVVDLLNYSFRTNLPQRPETMYRFYFAFLRGAARVFNKDWGISIYGQADPEVSLLGMTMAYDRGARWIYFWSSDRDHHLPFEEQLALAQGLFEHVVVHPRRPRPELIRAANDAIVLPYGFTFNVSDWQKACLPGLWQRDAFPVEMGTMEDGTPYYSVLRCAAAEVERLIDEEREFDIVIDVAPLKTAGYARLHDVLPRAQRMKYDYLWAIRGHYYVILGMLVAFLIIFRSYRIVRWIRRRKAMAASGT